MVFKAGHCVKGGSWFGVSSSYQVEHHPGNRRRTKVGWRTKKWSLNDTCDGIGWTTLYGIGGLKVCRDNDCLLCLSHDYDEFRTAWDFAKNPPVNKMYNCVGTTCTTAPPPPPNKLASTEVPYVAPSSASRIVGVGMVSVAAALAALTMAGYHDDTW
jgi:hypothetical protein